MPWLCNIFRPEPATHNPIALIAELVNAPAPKEYFNITENAEKSYQAAAWFVLPLAVELSHGIEYKKPGSLQHKTPSPGTHIHHPNHQTTKAQGRNQQ